MSVRDVLRFQSSAAIIRNGDRILAIERSDGLGLSLPGGVRYPWESTADCLRREVHEECGLELIEISEALRVYSGTFFKATAVGRLQDSCEGEPRWVTLDELTRNSDPELMKSLAPLLAS